jgi:putative ABC transport system substrate-binding protein
MHFRQWKRREFITLLGGAAAAWPLAARAQQPAMPVIGFLHPTSAAAGIDRFREFRRGLKEAGYVEGENVTVVYRFADGQFDRLPALAAELVARRVAIIVAPSVPAALAAKAATATTPIIFAIGDDPVRHRLVANLARPGGNATGVNFLGAELGAKRLNLMLELVPAAKRLSLLINPAAPASETTSRDAQAAAHAKGLQVDVFNADTSGEIDAAFVKVASERRDFLMVGGGALFFNRRIQLVQLAAHHRIPTMYAEVEFPRLGGLMGYGASIGEAYRQVGVYAGRILKGAKAADLPVVQSSKFELVINAQTARMQGLTVPPTLLALADEVIE